MFYIETPDGITVTESGRKTIFVPKNHKLYKEISENIANMSYDNVFEMIDIKTKVQKFISESVECFFNADDDLQIDWTLQNEDNAGIIKNILVNEIKKEFEASNAVEDLIHKLKIAKIQVIFE
jgi:hypothetical protein